MARWVVNLCLNWNFVSLLSKLLVFVRVRTSISTLDLHGWGSSIHHASRGFEILRLIAELTSLRWIKWGIVRTILIIQDQIKSVWREWSSWVFNYLARSWDCCSLEKLILRLTASEFNWRGKLFKIESIFHISIIFDPLCKYHIIIEIFMLILLNLLSQISFKVYRGSILCDGNLLWFFEWILVSLSLGCILCWHLIIEWVPLGFLLMKVLNHIWKGTLILTNGGFSITSKDLNWWSQSNLLLWTLEIVVVAWGRVLRLLYCLIAYLFLQI